MKVLNDYHCTFCNNTEELFLENSIDTVECQICEGTAKKVRSVPNFSLPGNDPAGFPTAYDQWSKKREQKMAQEKKSDNS